MGKISTLLTSVALLATALCPVDAGAQTKTRTVYTFGTSMGPTSYWTNATEYYYNTDGKVVRHTQLFQNDQSEITLQNYVYYTYDENGKLIEKIETKAVPTSSDNVDHEYVFTPNNKYVYIYNDKGQLVEEYYVQWKEKNKAYNESYKIKRHIYTYNEDGTKATETYWGGYSPTENNPDPKPNDVYTFDYADGQLTKMTKTGKNEIEYSYDDKGRLVHSVTTNTSGTYAGKITEETEYTYDGDFLAQRLTIKYSWKKDQTSGEFTATPSASRTVNTMVDNNPNHYKSQDATSSKTDENGDWIEWKNKPTSTETYKQDYAEAALYVPVLSVSKDNAESTDVNVSFTLSTLPTEAFTVKLFRDGYTIATLDKAGLEAALQNGKYVFVDKGLVNGEHEYFAQVVTGTDATSEAAQIAGYVSDIAKIEVVKHYPVVSNFTCKGYVVESTWTAPTVDEELVPQEGYWSEAITLSLEWTPLTEEQVAGLNFERYDIYVKGLSGIFSLESISDITKSSISIDWRTNYTEVWISAKFGEQLAESEHLTIDLATTPNLTPVTPVPVYGVIYKGGYTPAFVKADLSAPDAATEEIYDLWTDSKADLSSVKGGVTVGNTYYALVEDNLNYDVFLGAFDMTNKKYTTIGSAMTVTLSDLAYDATANVLYGVAPGSRRSTIYTIDLATGAVTDSELPAPANTYYIASDGAGKLYALAAADGKFNFYTINQEQYIQDKDIVLEGTASASNWSSFVYDKANTTLYFTNDKTLYKINPTNKAVWEPVTLKQAMSGIVFAMSTELPEVAQAAGGRTLAKHITSSGMTDYYYSLNGKLVRVVETGTDGVARITKNSLNEAGEISTSVVYEAATDEYGLPVMKQVSSVENTYNAEGKLEKASKSDGTWVSYTYDEVGNISTETYGEGETVTRTLTYEFADPFTLMISSEDGMTMIQYDETTGNKVREVINPDMMTGNFAKQEVWTYFEGTDIVSTHTIIDNTGETPKVTTIKYQMLDETGMVLMGLTYDGDGTDETAAPIEGSQEQLVYADLTEESARLATMELMLEKDTESVNTVKVKFTIPGMLTSQNENPVVNVFRDGVQIAQLGLDQLSELMYADEDQPMPLIVYPDKSVANGTHEYFVQAQDGPVGLQISNIREIELDTELPTVTDIAYVSSETKYTDAEGNITEETTGTPIKVVTIGWTNPEYPEEYGFISNNTFIVADAPVAGDAVTDATATQAKINFGTADKCNVMVQTRYNLGVANSEIAVIDATESGISEVTTADGINISLVNKVVKVSVSADIRVFDASGKLVANAQGTELDLSHLNGSHLVAVNCNGAVKVLKVAL